MRSPDEVTHIQGRDASGRVAQLCLVPAGVPALNPAFDMTPARLVDRLITEVGAFAANAAGVAQALADAAASPPPPGDSMAGRRSRQP
jgi:methylthioribose-1-phosphate isomerase